jgi:hypothetical protein
MQILAYNNNHYTRVFGVLLKGCGLGIFKSNYQAFLSMELFERTKRIKINKLNSNLKTKIMKSVVKKIGKLAFVAVLFIMCSAFVSSTNKTGKNDINPNVVEGKAYWFVSYMFDKKIYVSYVFNNDCNHCNNEIMAAYKKHLVMKDYVTNPNTANMLTYNDVTSEKLDERRDEQIYKRKQQGYSVINVSFSYKED